MREVKLKRMQISNFKGIKSLSLDFGNKTEISGKNASGKTSIYEAYLWTLFGKDNLGNEMAVQPYDDKNEIVHKIETTVALQIDVNNVEINIARSLKENWVKPRGQVDEVLKGRETTRYYNDVPVGESEFVGLLSAICPVDQWLILSSVDYFLSDRYGTDKRRAVLNAIAETFSEKDLAKDYPAVLKALNEGRNIDDYIKSLRIRKSKSKDDLDMIPARIDQQEKLRVDLDFKALKNEFDEVEKQIDKIEDELAAGVDTSKLEESKRLSIVGAELQRQMSEIEQKANKDYVDKKAALDRVMIDYQDSLDSAIRSMPTLKTNLDFFNKDIESNERRRQELRDMWIAKNSETPSVAVESNCPFCGADYPEERIEDLRQKAVAEYNGQKKKALADFEKEASTILKNIEFLKGEVEVKKQKISEAQQIIDNYPALIEGLRKDILKLTPVSEVLLADKDYQVLLKQANDNNRLLSELTTENDNEGANILKQQKDSLEAKRKELIQQISYENTNEKIDKEKEQLNLESKRLGQAIADIENEEYQFEQFKKARILKVQEEVDKHFKIVSFKMFEPNLTNDGEKKICQAIIDGVPYESQNTATKINAGIDIINGLSKVWKVSMPLFVDQKESVTTLLDTDSQLITLKVVENQSLKTTIVKQ